MGRAFHLDGYSIADKEVHFTFLLLRPPIAQRFIASLVVEIAGEFMMNPVLERLAVFTSGWLLRSALVKPDRR